MGSAVLPHLRTGWHVDQAILNEEERMVVIRFGRDHDPDCMRQDEVLYKIADRVKNFAVIYRTLQRSRKGPFKTLANWEQYVTQVSEENNYLQRNTEHFCSGMGLQTKCPILSKCTVGVPKIIPRGYKWLIGILPIELYDPMTLMFFWRNKHMMCDFGTGNNNKLNWVLEDKQELIDILETIYRGAKKGRGLVVSPKDYSTRYRYQRVGQ